MEDSNDKPKELTLPFGYSIQEYSGKQSIITHEIFSEVAGFIDREKTQLKEFSNNPSHASNKEEKQGMLQAGINHAFGKRSLLEALNPNKPQHNPMVFLVRNDKQVVIGFSLVILDSNLNPADQSFFSYTGVGWNETGQGIGKYLLQKRHALFSQMEIPSYVASVWERSRSLFDQLKIPYLQSTTNKQAIVVLLKDCPFVGDISKKTLISPNQQVNGPENIESSINHLFLSPGHLNHTPLELLTPDDIYEQETNNSLIRYGSINYDRLLQNPSFQKNTHIPTTQLPPLLKKVFESGTSMQELFLYQLVAELKQTSSADFFERCVIELTACRSDRNLRPGVREATVVHIEERFKRKFIQSQAILGFLNEMKNQTNYQDTVNSRLFEEARELAQQFTVDTRGEPIGLAERILSMKITAGLQRSG